MKKILIPVDFSNTAKNAIDFAVKMFANDSIELVVYNALPVLTTATDMLVSLDDVIMKERIVDLDNFVSSMLVEVKDVALQLVVEREHLVTGINQYLAEHDVDLIVMGTNGLNELSDFFFGTKTINVIESINIPLLLVPANCVYRDLTDVVYAKAFYKDEGIVSETFLHYLKEQFNARIKPYTQKHLLIAEGHEEDFNVVEGQSFQEGMQDYIFNNPTDLIVLSPRKMSKLKQLFYHSNSREMSLYPVVPLLMLPRL